MPVTSITTTSGHTIIPGGFVLEPVPAVVLVPMTQAQLVALTEALAQDVGTRCHAFDLASDALWDALEALDEHEGIQ